MEPRLLEGVVMRSCIAFGGCLLVGREAGADSDGLSSLGELECIGEEVPQDLVQLVFVTQDGVVRMQTHGAS